MKKLFYSFIAASLTAVGLLTPKVANAESIPMDPNQLVLDVEGQEVTVNMRNDFHDTSDGGSYPNFNFFFAENYADAFPAGSNVVVNYALFNGDTFVKDGSANVGISGLEVHTWWDLGKLEAGTYELRLTFTFNIAGKTEPVTIAGKTATMVVPEVNPSLHPATNAWSETPTAAGSDFNFDIKLDGIDAADIKNILICVLKGGEEFNNEAEFHYEGTNLTGTIPVTFGGDQAGYWLKGQITMNDDSKVNIQPWDSAITLHKKAAEKFEINLTIEPNGDFERTSATGGNLPYKFTATGSLDQVDHYVVWASRAGDEFMDETNVTDFEGVLALTVLPADASTGVWIKVKAVSKTGAESATVQYGPITCDTRAVDSFTCSIWAGNTKAVTATTGTVDIKLTVANGENIQSYRVFVVTNGEKVVGEATLLSANTVEPAATAAETTVAVNGETEFTLDLANLNDKAVTELWAKVTPTNKAGAELTTAQYPGEAQGWTGLSIDTSTISSSIDEITAENPDAIVNVYNFSGVIVRKGVRAAEATDGLPAGLYIVGSKKVAVK